MATVQNSWDLAKDLADMTGSSFPIDARGIQYANTALRVLHVALANAHNGDYFRSEQSVSVVAGTENYALAADFQRALKVVYEPSSGNRRYPVAKYNLDAIAGMRTSPVTAGTVKIWYAPVATAFTALSNTIPAIYTNMAEDYLAYHMAVQLLNREESYEQAGQVSGERDRVLASILALIEPRDEEPEEIADVYHRWEPRRRFSSDVEDQHYYYRIMGGNIYISEADWRGV